MIAQISFGLSINGESALNWYILYFPPSKKIAAAQHHPIVFCQEETLLLALLCNFEGHSPQNSRAKNAGKVEKEARFLWSRRQSQDIDENLKQLNSRWQVVLSSEKDTGIWATPSNFKSKQKTPLAFSPSPIIIDFIQPWKLPFGGKYCLL